MNFLFIRPGRKYIRPRSLPLSWPQGMFVGRKHPSRDLFRPKYGQNAPTIITSHDVLEPLKQYFSHHVMNLQLKVAKGFHIG